MFRKNNKKALSPVIASIILIAVTVAVAVVVASWMGGISIGLMDNVEQAKITSVEFLSSPANSVRVTILNSGSSSVKLQSAAIDDNSVDIMSTEPTNSLTIDKGTFANVIVTNSVSFTSGSLYTIKITTTKGNPLLFTVQAITQPIQWLNGWDKRVTISIDPTNVDTSLSNFPVLVHLSSNSGVNNNDVSFIFSELQSDTNRKKIAVTTENNSQCYVEIERWNTANNQAWLWVKVPTINDNAVTILYFYYDIDQTDNTNYVGDTGSVPAKNVWDSNYDMVLHLDESSGNYQDSTLNTKDASVIGSPIRGVVGEVNNAIEFTNAANQYIKTTTKLDSTDAFTIELWANLANTGNYQTVFYQGKSGSWQELFTITSAGQVMSWFRNGDWGKSYPYYWNYGELHYFVIAYDGNAIKIYEDGISVISPVTTNCNSADPQYWHIGGRDDATQPLNGVVDEQRFSTTNRSPAWIKATYESCRDNLISFGI